MKLSHQFISAVRQTLADFRIKKIQVKLRKIIAWMHFA